MTIFNNISTLVPITVISAIFLFFIKEVLELIRKYNEKQRKLQAIKIIIANELELNNWSFKKLYETLSSVQDTLKTFDNPHLYITLAYNKVERFHYKRNKIEKNDNGSWPIPNFHIKKIENLILDIAILDKNLLVLIQDTLDKIQIANHIRTSFIDAITNEHSYVNLEDLKENFYDYAINEKNEIEISMNNLYFACKSKELDTFKLR